MPRTAFLKPRTSPLMSRTAPLKPRTFPCRHRLGDSMATLRLGERCGGGEGRGEWSRPRGEVDYLALAGQLLLQRDAKQDALHEMEAQAKLHYLLYYNYDYTSLRY